MARRKTHRNQTDIFVAWSDLGGIQDNDEWPRAYLDMSTVYPVDDRYHGRIGYGDMVRARADNLSVFRMELLKIPWGISTGNIEQVPKP
jgi:hypothetical protein